MINKIKLNNASNRCSKMTENSKKGFTLIELVIVIAIMAVLSLIVVPSVSSYVESAQTARAEDAVVKVHRAALMVREVEGLHLGRRDKVENVETPSAQGIGSRVKLDPNSGAYNKTYSDAIESYIKISDTDKKNIEIYGSRESLNSATIRVYYTYNNGKNQLYATNSAPSGKNEGNEILKVRYYKLDEDGKTFRGVKDSSTKETKEKVFN